MRRFIYNVIALAVLLGSSGCGMLYGAALDKQIAKQQKKAMDLQKVAMQEDISAWREGRAKVVESYGERVIDQPFARTFDSIVTALGALELRVINMERQSGYITASGTPLPPDLLEPMQMDAFEAKCDAMGYDPGDRDVDSYRTLILYQNKTVTFTFSLVDQKEGKQTKVKVRASGVYYPPILAEMYKVLWQEIDKQLFLDKHLD